MRPRAETGGPAAGGAGAGRRFTLHAFVEGEKVRRAVQARLAGASLELGDRSLAFDSIFWVSRRSGLLLLFAEDFTAALKGKTGDLDDLSRAVERSSDQNLRRHRLLQPMAHEVVVCTAGTAVTGTIGGREVRGFHVAVFTQRALHLRARDRHHILPWPVGRARRISSEREGEALELRRGSSVVVLRYLFPEEIRAALRVADRAGTATVHEEEEDVAGALEMFARGDVAPPFPAELPEFTVSVDALQEESSLAAERIPTDLLARTTLPRHFFELHFQELGEIALGPLLLRKSAASSTLGLSRALEVMDAAGLRQDTEAAVASAAERLVEVYRRELEARLRDRRLSSKYLPGLAMTEEERARLRDDVRAPVAGLAPYFGVLEQRQEGLQERLRELESGPPEGEEAEVEGAAAEWREALRRLDRAYAAAWEDLLGRIEAAWSDTLLPRLARAETLPSRQLPGWVRWGILLAAVAGLGALALVLL